MTNTKYNLYTIKDVSEITGVHAQTLRNWEKDDLIEPLRVSGNQRIYTDKHIERIYEILDLKEEGLRLKGIRNVLLGKSTGVKRTQRKTGRARQPTMTAAQTLEQPQKAKRRASRGSSKKRTNSTRYTLEELWDMNLKELNVIARKEGVKYFRQMHKEELVTAIADPSRREEMKEQAKERTKRRYGHKVYGQQARGNGRRGSRNTVQYAQEQESPKNRRVTEDNELEQEGLVEANVVQDTEEEVDTQQLLIQQILNLGEEGKSPEEIAQKLSEAYK